MAATTFGMVPFYVSNGEGSSADESEIPTGLAPGVTLTAWDLQSMELNFDPDRLSQWGAADSYALTAQLTRRSIINDDDLIKDLFDKGVIMQDSIVVARQGTYVSATMASTTLESTRRVYSFNNVTVYAPKLYVSLIKTSGLVPQKITGRIMYSVRTLTQAEAVNLVLACS